MGAIGTSRRPAGDGWCWKLLLREQIQVCQRGRAGAIAGSYAVAGTAKRDPRLQPISSRGRAGFEKASRSANSRKASSAIPASSGGSDKDTPAAKVEELPKKRTKKEKRNDKHNSIVPDVIEERHRGSDDVDVYDKGKYLGKGGFARCYTMTSRTTGAVMGGSRKESLKKK